MRIATVGDACCDCYLDEGVWYPGGQALNVAVNALQGVDTVGLATDEIVRAALKRLF
jgi:fructoselysine 6-kinase